MRMYLKGLKTPKGVFYVIAIINIGIMFILLMATQGEIMQKMSYGESIFCDFWDHINRLLHYERLYGNLMDADAIFPPLAYVFLSPFARAVGFKGGEEVEPRITGWGILVLILYLAIFIISFVYMIDSTYEEKKYKKILLSFIFLFSYPFWGFAFERGNPVIYAMLFLMLGLFWRDSQSKVKRELALICIAISAGFKIYPALFGLLWIKEKRYKEAIRMIVYGIIAFFLPFVFFGGISAFSDYIGTFSRYLGKEYYSKTCIIGECIRLFGDKGGMIGKVVVLLWLLWLVYYLFTEKINWKTIALMTSACTIILPEAYLYTYVFIAIPIIGFLNEMTKKGKYEVLDYVYALLFALVLTIPPMVEGGVIREMYLCWIGILVLISIEKVLSKRILPCGKK